MTEAIRCKGCGLTPEQISGYRAPALDEGITPTQYVMENEGTYNPQTKRFYCDGCYIKAGTPLGKADAERPASPRSPRVQQLVDLMRKRVEGQDDR